LLNIASTFHKIFRYKFLLEIEVFVVFHERVKERKLVVMVYRHVDSTSQVVLEVQSPSLPARTA
jgi:hypothetical protein